LALKSAFVALLDYTVVVQRALAPHVTQLERTVDELQRTPSRRRPGPLGQDG
jgi:hypothetical protein